MAGNARDGSCEAANGANVVGWRVGSVNGDGCVWLVAVELDVRECSLIDRL